MLIALPESAANDIASDRNNPLAAQQQRRKDSLDAMSIVGIDDQGDFLFEYERILMKHARHHFCAKQRKAE